MGGKGLGSGLGVVFNFVAKLETDRSASVLSFDYGFKFWEESVLTLRQTQNCGGSVLTLRRQNRRGGSKSVIWGGSESGFGAKSEKGSKKGQKGSF